MLRTCGFDGFRQVRHRLLRAEERAARVDLMHQIEALHRRVERAGEADRRGVVDEDVDAAEALDRRGDRRVDLRFVADVGGDRERLAAGRFDIGGRRVDRARQLRMRLGGLRGDDDVGAVGGGAHRDRVADASRGSGDEERARAQRHGPQITRITPMREEPRQALRAWQCDETRDRKSAAITLSISRFDALPAPGEARRRGSSHLASARAVALNLCNL